MKYLGLMSMLLITSCGGTRLSLSLQQHPEWNWTDQAVFTQNVRMCRYADTCAAEQLFIR